MIDYIHKMKWISALFCLIILSACIKSRTFESPESFCISEFIANTTYAEVKALYIDETIQIQENLIIEGYVISSDEQGNFFRIRQVDGNVVIDNYINKSIMKVERIEMIEVPTKNTLSLNYGDFQYIDEVPFPFSGIVFLNYISGGQQFTTKIAFNFDKAELVDRKLKLPFNIPDKYERQ